MIEILYDPSQPEDLLSILQTLKQFTKWILYNKHIFSVRVFEVLAANLLVVMGHTKFQSCIDPDRLVTVEQYVFLVSFRQKSY